MPRKSVMLLLSSLTSYIKCLWRLLGIVVLIIVQEHFSLCFQLVHSKSFSVAIKSSYVLYPL